MTFVHEPNPVAVLNLIEFVDDHAAHPVTLSQLFPTHHTAEWMGILLAIEPNNVALVPLGEAQVARCGSREIERRTAIRFLFIDFPTAHIGRIGGSYTVAELWLSSSRLPT